MSKTSNVKLTAIKTIYLGNPPDPDDKKAKVGHTVINPGDKFETDAATADRLIASRVATDIVTTSSRGSASTDVDPDADPDADADAAAAAAAKAAGKAGGGGKPAGNK